MTDWVRMPNIYWAIHNERASSPEDLVHRVNAAQPITVTGDALDLFKGTVPSATQVPFFTDRHNRKYIVTADNKVRPAEDT